MGGKKAKRCGVGAAGAVKTKKWRQRAKLWAVLGAQCSSEQAYRRIKVVAPSRQVMDPPLQLEADEKVEEEEKRREQCRGVSGSG